MRSIRFSAMATAFPLEMTLLQGQLYSASDKTCITMCCGKSVDGRVQCASDKDKTVG